MSDEFLLLDRFRLTEPLGQGGMGVVYRAHDELLKRDVAIKMLSGTGLGAEGRARLLHEAQAAAGLSHPNIVAVYDAGEAESGPYIVMELVEGPSLHEQRPGQMADIVDLARQICAALDHAHGQGIVHRDLKPENVLLAPDGTAKLMDFGLARSMASRITAAGTITGTVFYMAPELALGQPYDGRADLYSLGVMLYELSTGELPFTAGDPIAIISQHLNAPVVPPAARNSRIPAFLNELIVDLMDKSPDGRPRSAADVLTRLATAGETPLTVAESELSVLDRIVRGRLVGREQEVQESRELWRRAAAGQGQTLLISGEPGIGKSRLVAELATYAELSGGRVLSAACYEETNAPYEPIAQILRAKLSSGNGSGLPDHTMADLLALVPDLLSRFPQIRLHHHPDSATEQQHLFDGLLTMCNALSDESPLLFFLDDVHWADSGTLSVLRHLARRTRDRRQMIVATYRETGLVDNRALADVVHDLNRERVAHQRRLDRFDRSGTEALLASLFAEAITPEFLDSIYGQTEGNPFFVEEVVKALVEEGDLDYRDGRWERPEAAELNIPQSVRLAIQSRVGRLPAEAQEALGVAAVLGPEFDYEILRQTSGLSEAGLDEALEAAEKAQLINEVQRPSLQSGRPRLMFAFVHALIPGALYEELSSLRRRRLHGRAGRALESTYPEAAEALASRMARHFVAAGDQERAIKYLLLAGERAQQLFAFQEAIEAYEQALALIAEPEKDPRAAQTLMRLGLLYHANLDFDRSRISYQRGFDLWQGLEERPPDEKLPPPPHALRTARTGPSTLDPTLAADNPSVIAIDQLFSGLVALNPDMQVTPDVATRWQVLDNGRRYIFNLRDDVFWSDGQPVMAGDFVFAWRRVLDPAINSPVASWLFDVRGARAFNRGDDTDPESLGVRAMDDYTLEVELESPAGHFLYLLARSAAFPVPSHVVRTKGDDWSASADIVVNGPFRLEKWEPDRLLSFVRYEQYHGTYAGNVERIEVILHSDDRSQADEMYESGRLDVLEEMSASARNSLRRRLAGEFIAGPGLHAMFIAFDLTRPPFDDARVRQALAMAIDRDRLAEVLSGNDNPIATGGFVPPGMPGHSEGIALAYDPDKARQLLSAAGYPAGRDFPDVDALTAGYRGVMVDFLRRQWRDVLGIRVDWEATDIDEVLRRQRSGSRPQLVRGGWTADYPDPDAFLRVGLTYQVPLDWHPEYERIVHEAGAATDQERRLRLFQRADRLLIGEAALVPLVYGRWQMFVKPWVRNFRTSPLRLWYWKDVILEPH